MRIKAFLAMFFHDEFCDHSDDITARKKFKTMIRLLVIMLCIMPARLYAVALAAEPVLFDGTVDRFSFCEHVEYLEDREKKLTIENVSTTPQNRASIPITCISTQRAR
jgi:hypothetical protein